VTSALRERPENICTEVLRSLLQPVTPRANLRPPSNPLLPGMIPQTVIGSMEQDTEKKNELRQNSIPNFPMMRNKCFAFKLLIVVKIRAMYANSRG